MNTTQEMDELKKKVADLVEIAKKTQESNDGYNTEVKKLLEDVLKAKVGDTPHRKIEFGGLTEEREMLESAKPEVKSDNDNLVMLSAFMRKPVSQLKSWEMFKRKHSDFKKAMDASTAGQGLEWVPTIFSRDLWEKVHLELKVAAQFADVPMPSNNFTLPVEIADLEVGILAEQTADTGQTTIPVGDGSSSTANVALSAKMFSGFLLFSKEIQEDSIIPFLPKQRERLVRGYALALEDVILNGDTSGTHMDSDTAALSATTSAIGSRRKSFAGLRADSIITTSYKTDLSTLNLTNIRTMRGNMGVYGTDPRQIFYVTGIKGYMKLLSLGEVVTIDKYGPSATVVSGELGKLDGSPVIVSEKVRENLNASGVYDGAVTSKTVLHIVNKNGFVIGTRDNVEIQLLVELYSASNQDALKIIQRRAFRDTYPIATNTTIWTGYNIAG